jgi:hypothetical protein
VGEGEDLAAPGQECPLLTWSTRLKSFENAPHSDQFRLTADNHLSIRTREGIRFRQRRFEVWAPNDPNFSAEIHAEAADAPADGARDPERQPDGIDPSVGGGGASENRAMA